MLSNNVKQRCHHQTRACCAAFLVPMIDAQAKKDIGVSLVNIGPFWFAAHILHPNPKSIPATMMILWSCINHCHVGWFGPWSRCHCLLRQTNAKANTCPSKQSNLVCKHFKQSKRKMHLCLKSSVVVWLFVFAVLAAAESDDSSLSHMTREIFMLCCSCGCCTCHLSNGK